MKRFGLFANPDYRRPARESPSIEPGTLPRQRVSLSCGEVTYLRHGSGPPLLLVHGIPTSARLWEGLLGDLGERFDCIAPDLLGLGESRARPGGDMSSAGQATMLLELLAALGIDEVLLALHDQGGAHGLQLIARAPERIRALAMCDIVAYDNWEVPAIKLMRAISARPRMLERLSAPSRAALLGIWPFPQTTERGPLPPGLTEDWTAQLTAGGEDLDAYCGYVRAQSPRFTAETAAILGSWTKPALVVWAGNDLFLPVSWGSRLAQDTPGAPDEPVILPFAGHFFHADVPRTAARVLEDFFSAAG